jgi:hypothetical protein
MKYLVAAYPIDDCSKSYTHPGMSTFEVYCAHALSGILANPGVDLLVMNSELIAGMAAVTAEAMCNEVERVKAAIDAEAIKRLNE